MGKGLYLGVGGLVRKAKRAYLGVSGAARKVKRAYVGIAGKAMLCYRTGGYQYHGNIGSLQMHRAFLAACSTGKTGIFAAGIDSTGHDTHTIEAYTDTLTVRTSNLPVEVDKPSSGNCDGYALLFGGYYGQSKNTRIVCIPDTLEMTYSHAWPYIIYTLPLCVSNGVHGIGGFGSYASARCYQAGAASKDCTFTNVSTPSSAELPDRGLQFGDRALFLCPGKAMYTYNRDLVLQRTSLTDYDIDAKATVGDQYFVFSSGIDYGQNREELTQILGIAYDRNLVRLTPFELYSANKSYMCSASADSYTILACHGDYVSPNRMHVVDENLVYTQMDNPMRSGGLGYEYASVRAGDYVLVVDSTGGYGNDQLHAFID